LAEQMTYEVVNNSALKIRKIRSRGFTKSQIAP
jgi:hypothetical protein